MKNYTEGQATSQLKRSGCLHCIHLYCRNWVRFLATYDNGLSLSQFLSSVALFVTADLGAMFHILRRQRLVLLYCARDEGSFMSVEMRSPGHPTTPATLTDSMLMGLCGARCGQDCKYCTSASSFMAYRLPLCGPFCCICFSILCLIW